MFSLLVLVTALWGLSFEMVEDSFVDLIYARMFGWSTFLSAFLIATLVVVPSSAAFVLLAPSIFQSSLPLVQKGGAVLLIVIGAGWLGFAVAGRESEVEEARQAERNSRGRGHSLVLATQLVAVEETEIVVILIPLVIASHPFEALIAAIVGVGATLVVALVLRRRFAQLIEGRLRLLKALSGVALLSLGLVLFFD